MGGDRVRTYKKSSSTLTPGFKPEKSSFLQPRYQDQVDTETDTFTEDKQQNSSEQSNPTPPFLGHSFGRVSVLPIQTKLAIGQANDKYEQEADRVADQVMRMPESGSPAWNITSLLSPPSIQRSPVSDAVEKSWNNSKKDPMAVLERLSFQDARQAWLQKDADLQKLLARIFPDANDLWVAERVLEEKLTDTTGEVCGQKLQPHEVKLFFFRGKTSERALVLAGTHGSEQQGIEVTNFLLEHIKKNQPHFSVIIVPSLFPDNAAHKLREERSQGNKACEKITGRKFKTADLKPNTNRNFPEAGTTVDEAKNVAGISVDKNGEPILPENIALMRLIERFRPSRIISIHGTKSRKSGGVFSDEYFLNAKAEQKMWHQAYEAARNSYEWAYEPYDMYGPVYYSDYEQMLKEAQIQVWAVEIFNRLKADSETLNKEKTANDEALALAAAWAIEKKTETVNPTGRRKRQEFTSVRGNLKRMGKKVQESAVWREDLVDPKDITSGRKSTKERTKKGVSLGTYAPGMGVGVFTVEPPENRRIDEFSAKKQKDREIELMSYAQVIAEVLLGPQSGEEALKANRPALP